MFAIRLRFLGMIFVNMQRGGGGAEAPCTIHEITRREISEMSASIVAFILLSIFIIINHHIFLQASLLPIFFIRVTEYCSVFIISGPFLLHFHIQFIHSFLPFDSIKKISYSLLYMLEAEILITKRSAIATSFCFFFSSS